VSADDPDDPEPGDLADDPRAQPLIDAIAEGLPVDWSAVRRESGLSEAIIRELEVLEKIAGIHHGDVDVAASHSLGEVMASARPNGTSVDLSSATPWGPLLLFEQVGRGSFGDVYRAWDPALEHEVALKRVRVSSQHGSSQSQRAVPDGRLLARVRHPNVITVHGACVVDGELGVWMDFVHGRTLDQIVRREGPLSAQEASVVGELLCDALAAAHQAGVLHRDIKAANVMREAGGRIVLLDFGTGADIAPPGEDADAHMAGTPLYMAPELFEQSAASVQSDIYSLGVLLFYLVTGDFPVRAKTTDGIRKAHAAARRVLLADVRPGLPKQFVRAVERATAHDPADRFRSAGEMLAALAEPTSPARPALSWPVLAAAGTAAVVLLPFLLGQLTTAAYNFVVGRVEGFADDSLISTWTIGRHMLLAPAVYVLVTYLMYRLVAAFCRRMAAWPIIARQPIARRVRRLCARVVRPFREMDSGAMGDLLLAGQVILIVALCWIFWNVISASLSPLTDSEPIVYDPFRRGGNGRHVYRYSLTVALFVMLAAWMHLLYRRPRAGRVGPMNAAAGFALAGLVLILLVLPYRIIWMSDGQRVDYEGMRCYITGSQPRNGPQQYLLYCPDASKPKVRIVPVKDPALRFLGRSENIFTPA
jgi:serine/threonine-protein kinase